MGSSSFGFRQQLWLQQRYLGRRDSIWGLLSRKRKGLGVDALHCQGIAEKLSYAALKSDRSCAFM